MKKFLLLCSSLLLSASVCTAAQDSLATAVYTMGGGSRENGMLGVKLDNGQSALFNITSNCLTAQCQHGMAGIRIDQNGNLLHYKKFGHSTIDVDPNEAIYTSDKHILLVGQHGLDRILMKIDTMFNVVWSRTIHQRQDNYLLIMERLVERNNAYYMVCGATLTKVKSDGTVVFSKYYGPEMGTTDEYLSINFNALVPISGGRFFIAGELNADPNTFAENGFLSIVDSNGNFLKQKQVNVGGPYGNTITHAFKESENRFRIFGRHHNDIYTALADSNFAVTAAKKISGAVMFDREICYNGSDRYLVSISHAGTTLMMLDNNANVVWGKSYAGGWNKSLYQLSNCTYAAYGSINTGVNNGKTGFWLKVNEDGQSGNPLVETTFTPTVIDLTPVVTSSNAVDSGQWQTTFPAENFIFDNTVVSDSLWYRKANVLVCPDVPQNVLELASTAHKDLCAPNPFRGQMRIGNDWELNKIEKLMVYDITGRVILEQDKPSARTIELTENVKGLIFVKWTYEGVSHTQKMMAL